jgi:tetratricopeptide (TPR) repeat protein
VIVRRSLFLACLAASITIGCARSAADHEALGDRAYVAGNHAEALTEYRLALLQGQGSAARLHAKAAAAAVRAGDLEDAAKEYGLLARADGQRLQEAADGLELVAREATKAGDRPALRAAAGLLRDLDTGRSLGPYAAALVQTGAGGDGSDIAMLPTAAANASDARIQDSLMFVYAQALARAGRCERAVDVFEALARRARLPIADAATAGAALCALTVAHAHLDAGRNDPAEAWFRRAITLGDDTPAGRAAYLGLGDVLRVRGDLFAAVTAWERVIASGAPGDSLAEQARTRLNALGNPGTAQP